MFLDISLGIFFAVAINSFTSLPLTTHTIVVAVIFSLLPDLDFPAHLTKKREKHFHHEHRDLFHNPLIFLPIGFLIIAWINMNMASLFFFCVFAHFLHDSIGMGWGVRWLYPFSRRYYKFFSDKEGRMSRNLVTSWAPHEQREVAINFGNPNWLKDYLWGSRELLLEMLVFALAIIYLFYAWY